MIFLASLPSSVPCLTWSRSMSPVARWQTLYFSLIVGAWVPLPAEGEASTTSFSLGERVDETGRSKAIVFFSLFRPSAAVFPLEPCSALLLASAERLKLAAGQLDVHRRLLPPRTEENWQKKDVPAPGGPMRTRRRC